MTAGDGTDRQASGTGMPSKNGYSSDCDSRRDRERERERERESEAVHPRVNGRWMGLDDRSLLRSDSIVRSFVAALFSLTFSLLTPA